MIKCNIDAAVERIRSKMLERGDLGWEESLHPRSKNGQFTGKNGSKGGGSGNATSSVKSKERFTNTTKTKSGVSYPKLKHGAKFGSSIDVAQNTAYEDEEKGWIPKGTWDDFVRNLTNKDIVYQETPSGKYIASIPGAAAYVDSNIKGSARMKKIFTDAVNDGNRITPDMINAAKSAGMYMDGLENSVKGASHIEDKAKRKLAEYKATHEGSITEDDVAESFSDLVRYTAVTNNDNIVNGVNKMQSELKKAGYTIAEVDNKFMGKDGKVNNDAVYRAVHIQAISPSGRKVEVQIHSEDSLAVKDLNHREYEEQRDMEKIDKKDWTPDMIKKNEKLNKVQVDRWHKMYKNPPGIETIKSFKNI